MQPKDLHDKSLSGDIMTPDLKQLAMKALQDFRSGDLCFGDHPFKVTFPKGYLAGVFREWVGNQCDDGKSLQAVLELNKIFWSPSRIVEIETGKTDPTLDELLEWCDVNTDLCEANAIITWALNHDNRLLGWALIELSGFALDPDIELIGTFTNMDELRQFVADNFEG
jgi:hypothetical protein